jgi:hypothetical protein
MAGRNLDLHHFFTTPESRLHNGAVYYGEVLPYEATSMASATLKSGAPK